METDIFVLGPYKVMDSVRPRCVSTAVTEPLGACKALDHGSWVMYSTVAEYNSIVKSNPPRTYNKW